MSEQNATSTTPLARYTAAQHLREFASVRLAAHFGSPEGELAALVENTGLCDMGWLQAIRITGEDRVRWLNGMVTNSIQELAADQTCYTFLLNAQGRIQGDALVLAKPDHLLFITDAVQAPKLLAHLDRFIIMDDVELTLVEGMTALQISGPKAPEVIAKLHSPDEVPPLHGAHTLPDGNTIVQPRKGTFLALLPEERSPAIWEELVEGGAVPCGIDAAESARVLAGQPRYGADIHEKSLAQETGVAAALHFNKGCYLGQEIVERVRSRGAVNRSVRAFRLEGTAPQPGTTLTAEGVNDPVGELTSVATVAHPAYPGIYALGSLRNEFATRALAYAGGTATPLATAPLL